MGNSFIRRRLEFLYGKSISLLISAIIISASTWAPAPVEARGRPLRNSSPQPAPAPQPSPATADLFTQQAGQVRASTCAGLYAALGNAATAGSAYTLRTEADRDAPNVHPVQGTVGMTYDLPDMRGRAAALVSVAPVGNTCEGQFVRVVPFAVNCSQVLRDFPAGSKPVGDLSGVPFYQLGGGGGQALTIPNGENCVVISIVQGQQQL